MTGSTASDGPLALSLEARARSHDVTLSWDIATLRLLTVGCKAKPRWQQWL
jgi:hypothetical protein